MGRGGWGWGVGRWVVTYKCNIFYYLFIIFDIDLRLIVIHHRPWEGGFFFIEFAVIIPYLEPSPSCGTSSCMYLYQIYTTFYF